MNIFTRFFLFSFFFFLGSQAIFAQTTRIRGKVTDKETGQPLPYVTLILKGTSMGSVTDENGQYFIETRKPCDTIVVSTIGYYTQKQKIKQNSFQNLDFVLETNSILMNEIVVRPGEDPALGLMRTVIKNKEKNNPDKIPLSYYQMYNKMQFDINNLNDKLKDRKLMKQLKFVYNYMDTSAESGKTFLPFMILESTSDVYHQAKPKLNREVVTASRISGVDNQSVAQFTGKLALDFNLYDNFINVFDQGFVSPISDMALFYYKFKIIDSTFIDNTWCIQLSFKARRKQEPTFTGFMWVADTSYAVKRIQWTVSDDININFVKKLIATNEYIKVDSFWVPSYQHLFVDFNLTDKTTGFYGRKTTTYRNYKFGDKIPHDIKKEKTTTLVADDVMNKSEAYWDSARQVPLTNKEKQIYSMVDSIEKLPIYKTFSNIAYLMFDYYYEVGKFEFGPYFTTYSFNPVEGNRFRIGGRTSNKFSKKLMLNGHVAYGTRDGKFKYGAGIAYLLSKKPRLELGASFDDDVLQLGKSDYLFVQDNILTSLLRRNPNNKLTYVHERKVYFEKEWFQGLSNNLSFKYRRIVGSDNVPFKISNPADPANPIVLSDIRTSEISLNTRFAFDEKYLMGEFERISLGTDYPVININYTQAIKGVLNSKYNYSKLTFDVSDKIPVNPIGYLRVKAEAGQVFGTAPYPLLELHKGNETYAFDYFAFNMMNYYEFVSDRWISAFAEQHFQGLFLNHVPLFRKLKWREVASIRGVVGSVSERNRASMIFPEGLHGVSQPYYEASAGIENIFKVFRIDCMWRLSHLDHENIQPFGLRATLQIIF